MEVKNAYNVGQKHADRTIVEFFMGKNFKSLATSVYTKISMLIPYTGYKKGKGH